ncbi:hypothetical protein ERJ75_000563200 [Trypanosoma vivax]|nr:hypothetical protein ERJ75_000563200 [Trypanosoma vivax]
MPAPCALLLLLPDVTVPALLPALVPTAEVSWPPATRRMVPSWSLAALWSSGLPRPPARIASAHCEARRAPLPACASAARASQVIDGCRRRAEWNTGAEPDASGSRQFDLPSRLRFEGAGADAGPAISHSAAPLSPQGNFAAHAVVCRLRGPRGAAPAKHTGGALSAHTTDRTRRAALCSPDRPLPWRVAGEAPAARTRGSRAASGRGLSPRLPAGWKRAPSVRRLQGRRGHA